MEMVDQNNGIVGSTTGSNYYVRILSTINREMLKPSASVALHRHSNALVDVLPPEADSSISLLSQSEKPDVTYNVSLIFFIIIIIIIIIYLFYFEVWYLIDLFKVSEFWVNCWIRGNLKHGFVIVFNARFIPFVLWLIQFLS